MDAVRMLLWGAGFPILLSIAGLGQAGPALDVASVRVLGPSHDPPFGTFAGGPGTSDPGRINFNDAPLAIVIMRAFDIPRAKWGERDLILGPAWLDIERYDIAAKVPEGATSAQLSLMLQNLLAERFKLTLHREMHEAPGYELVVAKGGPKSKNRWMSTHWLASGFSER
jgi:uncharacterized protein (TIGR03435 family)